MSVPKYVNSKSFASSGEIVKVSIGNYAYAYQNMYTRIEVSFETAHASFTMTDVSYREFPEEFLYGTWNDGKMQVVKVEAGLYLIVGNKNCCAKLLIPQIIVSEIYEMILEAFKHR